MLKDDDSAQCIIDSRSNKGRGACLFLRAVGRKGAVMSCVARSVVIAAFLGGRLLRKAHLCTEPPPKPRF